VGIAIAIVLVPALAVITFLLYQWVSGDSDSDYARTHVQALFVDGSSTRKATVRRCRELEIRGIEPGEKVWSCEVESAECSRRLKFSVDHMYGTAPYDDAASDATVHLCRKP
jgi:hypothetical protein